MRRVLQRKPNEYEGSKKKGNLVLRQNPSLNPLFSFVFDQLNFPSQRPFMFLCFPSSPFVWPFISTKGRFLAHGGGSNRNLRSRGYRRKSRRKTLRSRKSPWLRRQTRRHNRRSLWFRKLTRRQSQKSRRSRKQTLRSRRTYGSEGKPEDNPMIPKAFESKPEGEAMCRFVIQDPQWAKNSVYCEFWMIENIILLCHLIC